MGIAKRAMAIKPSPTLATAAKAKAMKAQGIDVIDFGVGEPDFDTPENVKQAGIKAIQSGFTKYTPAGGTDELKDAVIDKFKKDNDLTYERSAGPHFLRCQTQSLQHCRSAVRSGRRGHYPGPLLGFLSGPGASERCHAGHRGDDRRGGIQAYGKKT